MTHRVFVANDDTVSVLQGNSHPPEVIATVSATGPGGNVVAVDERTGMVYVGHLGLTTVTVMNGRAPTPFVVTNIDLGAGVSPTGIDVDTNNSRVFVADRNSSAPGKAYRINGATNPPTLLAGT